MPGQHLLLFVRGVEDDPESAGQLIVSPIRNHPLPACSCMGGTVRAGGDSSPGPRAIQLGRRFSGRDHVGTLTVALPTWRLRVPHCPPNGGGQAGHPATTMAWYSPMVICTAEAVVTVVAAVTAPVQVTAQVAVAATVYLPPGCARLVFW